MKSKRFTFDTTNDIESIDNMSKFFNNVPITLVADANLLGILIIACAYKNINQVELITDCLQLLGYRVRRYADTDGCIDITLINDGVYMNIRNNEVTQW